MYKKPFLRLVVTLAWLIGALLGLDASKALALDPSQVLVVVNDSSPESLSLAGYYRKARNIPKKNFVHISCTSKDAIPRWAFEKDIVAPLKKALSSRKHLSKIRCLLLTYGVPLRIFPGKNKVKGKKKKKLDKRLQARFTTIASVDSELMTLMNYGSYPLRGWIPNPLYPGRRGAVLPYIDPEKILMVSRIDGPDLATSKRIIDDAIYAEKHGLRGKVCLDSRYKPKKRKQRNAYHIFDDWIRNCGKALVSRGMTVVLDERPELFSKGQCEDCALYCGWYSLRHYVDSCTWARGAIAYHVASGECVSLHKPSLQWCRMLLEKGACVTLGPVSEPYLEAFPPPNLFFTLLVDNGMSVAQAYLYSIPVLSWKMVLIGDPLYSPFRKRPLRIYRKKSFLK
ncbi:MAG: TIGR03790 family protein [Thermodesulfobacteria bacterium]|nr:TIGR03790 family protein [Thermodesulfobacteriota bacterium]